MKIFADCKWPCDIKTKKKILDGFGTGSFPKVPNRIIESLGSPRFHFYHYPPLRLTSREKIIKPFFLSFFKWKILVTPHAQCACYRGESTVARHRGVRLLKCWEGHYWVKPRSLTLRYDVHGGVWLCSKVDKVVSNCSVMDTIESDFAVWRHGGLKSAVWWTR